MKTVQNYTLYGDRNIHNFLANHVDETIRVKKVFDNAMVFAVEYDKSVSEIHMDALNNILIGAGHFLTHEEIAAIEYSIECIKTLDDMGILKGEQKND